MNTKPYLQKKLYGLNPTFDEIVNLYKFNKLPNKILFTGSKSIGKSTLAYHFINYVFSVNENHSYNIKTNEIDTNNNSFKLIKNGSHPNFHLIDLIDEKKSIEISQIRNMINYANKSFHLSIINSAFSYSCFFTFIFGVNIKNGLEDKIYMFYILMLFTIIFNIPIYFIIKKCFKF